MKIADPYGRLFQPGLISDIPMGKVLWVDSVYGNDALAVRERMTVPFKTLGAAKAAATSGTPGDTIIVLPGVYNEKNLLKNGVNWHFLPGAKVLWNQATAGAIFDASSGAAVVCSVTGHGEFEAASPATSSSIVHTGVAGSDLLIQARSMKSVDTCVKVGAAVTTGKLAIDVIDSIKATNAAAVLVSGTVTAHRIRADEIYSDYGGLIVTGGGIYVDVRSIGAFSVPAVDVTGPIGGVTVRAFEIYSVAYIAARFSGTQNTSMLNLIDARIRSTGVASVGRSIQVTTNVGANLPLLKLTSCVLVASGDVSIGATDPLTNVQVNGGLVANKDKGTVSFLPAGVSFLFHSTIT